MVNISTLGQYLNMSGNLKNQQAGMTDLTLQLSTGKKTQSLSGLGADIMKTTRARTSISSLKVYNDNITNANRRIKLMDTAIAELKKQTEHISSALATAVQQGDYPDLESIQKTADNIYDFIIGSLINQKDADRYLFGGANTTEPPINDVGLFESTLGNFVPDSSDLTQPPLVASGLVGEWGSGNITTDQFIAAYHGANDTVLGFTSSLTTGTAGKTTVRVNDTTEFDYTTLANNTSMRDIVMAVGVLRSLPPVDYAPGALNDPTATTIASDVAPWPPKEKQDNFFKVINDLTRTMESAIDALEKDQYRLAQVQAQTTIMQNSHKDQIATYEDMVGQAEDADPTEVSVRIKQLEMQLQASFQVTALMSQLTLANYLR
ncbi:MAG: hypothetical protein DI626_01800 [Micavibrio aeruginosavorus]|uniref:Flagellin N-terminal domain-containing protein n=1 Tax=Micavibrio aeruginosavorus TaxID=349221 RepID=A0A2W5BZA9_9BACT|nr:MAG: hypothetical protein DI626_01800 [Micavibrio aeruginosavorus]